MTTAFRLAACVSIVAIARIAEAGFTVTVLPSAQSAPAGRYALDLFVQNDQADQSDGINLQAVKMVFTGLSGTKVFFSSFDNGDGTIGVDQYNFGAGTSGTNVTDPGSSNLRIGTRTAGQHAFPNYPGDSDSPVTADEAANGLSSWSADYAVLSAAVSVPTPTPPGARFARLVFNTSNPVFRTQVSFAGEVGVASTFSYQYPSDIGLTVTPDTVTVDVSPPGMESFGQVFISNGFSTGTITNSAIPSQIADNLTIAGSNTDKILTGAGFTYADIGTYKITFSNDTGSVVFTLNIVPEPTMFGMLALSTLAALRRERR